MQRNETVEGIIKYLASRCDPLSVIVYGSWADGSNNAGSDFDALVITRGGERGHDTSFVGGIQLDAFIYPESSVGADAESAWLVMDELMSTLQLVNNRAYDSVMRKIRNI